MSEEERLTRAREELTEAAGGFVAMWYPQAVGADGGALFEEHLMYRLLPVVDAIARRRAAAVLRATAAEQRNEALTVPDTDEGTHADGHRCAAEFLDRRADVLDRNIPRPGHGDPGTDTKGRD